MKKHLFLLFMLVVALMTSVSAQAPNDDCVTAQNLGALPTPQSCTAGPVPTRGQGAPVSFSLNNTTGTASVPYVSMTGCNPGGATAAPASDVWYQVTLTGTELDVTIPNAGLGINPNIALWSGTCGNLTAEGCATSNNALTTTFVGLTPGVYYIQVSGSNVGDRGNFTLTLQNNLNCAACLGNTNLTVTPLPTNGYYPAGTTVNFCFTVTGWTIQSANWFEGVDLNLGGGWNAASLTGVPAASCDGSGSWALYNSVTSSATGTVYGPGFFYQRNPPDGNPGNDFGDNCGGAGRTWTFCWTLTTRNNCGQPGFDPDLSIVINTLADGEAGSWTSIACQGDPDAFFSAQITCCPRPTATATPILCNGACTSTITATPAGTGPWDYTFINQATNAVVNTQTNINGPTTLPNVCAGTYIVETYDRIEGCTARDTVIITQPTAITATPVVTNVSCNGGNNGSISVNGAAGGTGAYQYSLNGGPFQVGNVFNGLVAGTYTVTIRDANNCTVTLTGIVVAQPNIITSTPVIVNVLCNGGSTGSITMNATAGGTGAFQYSLNGGPFQAGNAFTGLPAGTYTVTIRDANNCTRTFTGLVITQPAVITGTPAVVNVLCNGGNTGSITINGTAGGAGAYQYSLNGGPFQVGNVFGGLVAGTYTVTIRDGNNCTVTLNGIVVGQPAAITGTPAVVNALCNGGNTGSITINGTAGGTGAYQYSLNGGPFQVGNVFGGLVAGTYTVTIRDGNNCTVTLPGIVVGQPAAITGTPAVVNVLCNGGNNGSITINGTAGGTGAYQYSLNGGPFQAGNLFNGLVAGTYTVTIRDGNNCTVVLNGIVVGQPAVITATPAIVNVACNGGNTGSITLNATAGGAGGYQYSLNGGPFQAGNAFTGLVAGTYTVTIRDANNCTVTLNGLVVGQPTAITGTVATTPATCTPGNDGTITVNGASGGTGALQYSINGTTFQPGNVFTGLPGGTYTVTIRDANGCTFTLPATIAVPGGVAGTVATTSPTCNGGTNGSITITASSSNPPIQYSLNGGPFQAGNTFINQPGGPYTVTVIDNAGCSIVLSGSITQPAAITGTPATINVTCNGGNDGAITINGTAGGNGVYQYSLNGGPFQAGNTFGTLPAGTYSVTIRDGNNCSTVINGIVIGQPAAITGIPAVTAATCNGASTGAITINGAGGGSGALQFSLNGGPFQAGNTFTGLPAGTYSVTIRDASNCTLVLNGIVVGQPAAITATPAIVNVLCNGGNTGSITINGAAGGTGAFQYSLNGGPFQAGNAFTGLIAGTYSVTVRDANNCTLVLNGLIITQPAALTATPAVTNVSCNGGNDGSITINATAGGTGAYQYSLNGGPFQVGNTFGGLIAGTYSVTVRDGNNCTLVLNGLIVGQPTAITASSAVANVLCNGGNTGTITINGASGGTGAFQYSLNGGPFQVGNSFGTLTAGTYTVTVRDANNCTLVLNGIVITQPAAITATAALVNVSCNGLANGSITINGAAGGTGAFQYSLNGGPFQVGNSFSGLGPSVNTVVVRDANGCTLTLNGLAITEPTAITATATATTASCVPGNDGTITVNGASGGTGALQYSAGGPFQSSNVLTGLAPGPYTVTVRDANGCTFTLPATVPTPPAVLSSANVVNPTCFGGTDGSILILNVTGTAPFQYSLNGGPLQSGNSFLNQPAGPWSVLIIDDNGCTELFTDTLFTPPAINATTTSTGATCTPGNDGSITVVNPTGGNGVYQFSLNGGPLQGSNVFPNLNGGNYTVTVTDGNGCTFSLPATVATPGGITATTAVVNVSCNGGTNGQITMNATSPNPPIQYSLNGGAFQAGNVFPGLPAGNYTVDGRDALGCIFTANLVVTEPAAMTAIDSLVQIACNGDSTGQIWLINSAGGTGAFQYSLNGGPFQLGNSFTGLPAGTYNVAIQDANNCPLALPGLVLTEPGALTAQDSVIDASCMVGNDGEIWVIQVAGGNPGYLYSLNGGAFQAGNSFTGLGPQTYTLQVRDANGCTFDLSATVNQPGGLSATANLVHPTCFGNTDGAAFMVTTGGTAPFAFSLNGGATQPSNAFIGLGAGPLTLVVTDSNNCAFTIVDTLVEPAVLSATDSIVNVLCPGQGGGEIWINNTAGGTPGYTYSLNGGAPQTSPVFTGLFPNTNTITITDSNGCVLTLGPSQLTEPNAFAGVLVAQDVACNGGNDGSLTVVSAAGGTPPYQFSIDGINYQVGTVFSGLTAGPRTITLRDSVGCLQTLLGTVNEPSAINGTISANPAICNTPNGNASIQVSGGVGGFSFLWTTGDTSANIDSLAPGWYFVTATDTNGCAYTDSILVPALNVPNLAISGSADPLCTGDANGHAVASASGGTGPLSYLWTPGGSTSDSIAGLVAGTYSVSVTDSIGCIVTTSVVLTDPQPLSLIGDSLNPNCFGFADGWASVLVSGGTPGYTYLWSDGQNDSLAVGLLAAAYSVSVTDANGCADSLSFQLQDPPLVVAAFTSNPAMPVQLLLDQASISLSNQSVNASSYAWTFGDGGTSTLSDPTYTYTSVGTFCVTLVAQDSAGCRDTVEACAYTIYQEELRIPNTFTPNGDNQNDVFEIVGVDQFPNNNLRIFNRWGNLVYEKAQYNNEWDGRNYEDGKPLPDGGYFYIFETGEADVAPIQGDVVIFR